MSSYVRHTNEVEHKDEAGGEGNRKPVRVWMDGSFDMLHLGHIAAMVQARSLGDRLIVGAQSDADVIAHKGPPVHPEQERFRLIQALKCVDEFVGAASYGTSVETLDKHGCDFCVHGDDATLRASDTDVIKQLLKINRARLVCRGFGISTTTLIQRILQRSETEENQQRSDHSDHSADDMKYMPTASQICAFANKRVPERGEKIVYVDGSFDLFNVGHLSFLEKAAQEGDYLLVAVHSDSTVTWRKGRVFPVLTFMERAMLVLSLKCVSDVLFGAPASITQDFLDVFKIDVVCRGKHPVRENPDGSDPYAVPKKNGIFKLIDSGCDITTQTIFDRIVSRRADYVARNKRKINQEANASKQLKGNK